MRVTKHFEASEFDCKDGTAYPAEWYVDRLVPLCSQLEILRAALRAPIVIVSGYRSESYNKRINGARSSQHVQGRAADIRVAGYHAEDVHAAALQLYRDGTLKIGGLGLYARWVHVDVRPGKRLARWSSVRDSG